MKTSVSVIIPCYNCASTIRRAVHSVLGQTVQPMQLILVDDASKDGTAAALRRIQLNYGHDFIEIITLEYNSGPSAARNAAWNIAKGDYLAFLDADDSWHPQKIEIQYNWMVNNPEAAVSGHLCVLSPNDTTPGSIPAEWKAQQISRIGLLASNQFSTPTVMLGRRLPFRFREGQRYAEDYLLWLQILLSGNKTYRLPLPMTFLFKERYGASGLSFCMWQMMRGELSNYWVLYRNKSIDLAECLFFCLYSFAKYLRRKVIILVIKRTK